MAESYAPPVDLLLIYGDPRKLNDWPDYLQLGFTSEHVADLICMASDPALIWADSESIEVWAPVHAWRTLGQLHAEAAIKPLIALWNQVEEDDGWDDWLIDDLPHVFSLIGEASIPELVKFLEDRSKSGDARLGAAIALQMMAEKYPEQREHVVEVLTDALSQFKKNEIFFNSLLISYLLDLNGVEAAETIKAAFYAKRVDPMVQGDWFEVKKELGFAPDTIVPGPEPEPQEIRPFINPAMIEAFLALGLDLDDEEEDNDDFEEPLSYPGLYLDSPVEFNKAFRESQKKAKAKRKQAKKSRKQNRKHK